jgi:hypothetical protein
MSTRWLTLTRDGISISAELVGVVVIAAASAAMGCISGYFIGGDIQPLVVGACVVSGLAGYLSSDSGRPKDASR